MWERRFSATPALMTAPSGFLSPIDASMGKQDGDAGDAGNGSPIGPYTTSRIAILTHHAWVGHVDGDGVRYAGPEHRHSRDCPEGGNRATARHRKAREVYAE